MITRRHIHAGQIRKILYHGPGRESLFKRFSDYDIVITTYETLRSEWGASEGTRPLLSWKWLRVILDEGESRTALRWLLNTMTDLMAAHHIRNRSAQVFQCVCDLKSCFRWCLTGTPIHNSLDDYGALLSFIRVYPFEQKAKFTSWIVDPLKMETNNELNIHRLQQLIRTTCLRRLKEKCLSSKALKLPPRSEVVTEVQLNEADQALYDNIREIAKGAAARLDKQPRGGSISQDKEINILTLINALRLICDHGKQLLPNSVESMITQGFEPFSSPRSHQYHGGKCFGCGGELETLLDLDGTNSYCINCMNSEESSSRTGKPSIIKVGENILPQLQNEDGKPSHSNGSYEPSAKVLALLKNLKLERMTGCKSRKRYVQDRSPSRHYYSPGVVSYSVAGPKCWILLNKHCSKSVSSSNASTEILAYREGTMF